LLLLLLLLILSLLQLFPSVQVMIGLV